MISDSESMRGIVESLAVARGLQFSSILIARAASHSTIGAKSE